MFPTKFPENFQENLSTNSGKLRPNSGKLRPNSDQTPANSNKLLKRRTPVYTFFKRTLTLMTITHSARMLFPSQHPSFPGVCRSLVGVFRSLPEFGRSLVGVFRSLPRCVHG